MRKTEFMKNLLLATTIAVAMPALAQAHFLLEYTDDTMIERYGDVPVKLIFWHPFEAGHVMSLEKPEEFFVIHNGEKTDLMETLEETTFEGPDNSAKAFMGSVPVKRSGDYVVVTVPAPYYEETEDIYIQQITKAYLNRNELPTDWDQPQDLITEILPLNKPYNIIAGSTFTGRVLSARQPSLVQRSKLNTSPPRPTWKAPEQRMRRRLRFKAERWSRFLMTMAISHLACPRRAIGALPPKALVRKQSMKVRS